MPLPVWGSGWPAALLAGVLVYPNDVILGMLLTTWKHSFVVVVDDDPRKLLVSDV